ncbi:MAG: hypothetical protein GF315_10755 [candidate division Zixibacteria bacterium]|nr:hypothetical protein [candidate division Zixibacteria bacterium]
MYKQVFIFAIMLVLMMTISTNAALFFPEDETKTVKNFTKSLPEGRYNPPEKFRSERELPKVSITHMAPLEAKENEEFSISATVKNLPQGALVVAHYRLNSLSQYRDVPMKEIAPERYATTIDARFMEGEQLQYYLEATYTGKRLANSGDFGIPHNVVLIGSGGVPKFAMIVVFGIGGIWLFSRFSSSGKKKESRPK